MLGCGSVLRLQTEGGQIVIARHIAQIAATSIAEEDGMSYSVVYALGNDGSLWKMIPARNEVWEALPGLPEHPDQ